MYSEHTKLIFDELTRLYNEELKKKKHELNSIEDGAVCMEN